MLHEYIWSYHAVVKCKNSHISAMVDVIPSDDGISVVFYPDPSQGVVWDLVVFIYSLQGEHIFNTWTLAFPKVLL